MLLNFSVIRKEKVMVKQASKVRRKWRNVERALSWDVGLTLPCTCVIFSKPQLSGSSSINWVHYDRLRPHLAPNRLWLYREFPSFNNSSWSINQLHPGPGAKDTVITKVEAGLQK